MPGLAGAAGAGAAPTGLAKAIPGVNLALTAAQMIGTGAQAGKEAKKQGATTGQAILEGTLASVGLDGLYTPSRNKRKRSYHKNRFA